MISFNYSSIPSTDFKKGFFICHGACPIQPDKKHADPWKKNPGILCRRTDRAKSKDGNKIKSFKEVLQHGSLQ